jgi:hypothetical protein
MDIQGKPTFPFRYVFVGPGYDVLALFFTGVFVRYPNLRYGNPTELAYYAVFWGSVPHLAKFLRRDERTVRDWINAKTRVPWWVPEILRLKRMEAELRHQQMGMGRLPTALGVVAADVIAFPQRTSSLDKAIPILDPHAAGEELHLRPEVVDNLGPDFAALHQA